MKHDSGILKNIPWTRRLLQGFEEYPMDLKDVSGILKDIPGIWRILQGFEGCCRDSEEHSRDSAEYSRASEECSSVLKDITGF